MRLELDRARLEDIVRAVADRLAGEWLLIGGAAVALWLEPRRVTEDLDLIGLGGTADERYRLMDFAHDLGLPVEAVNSAADFFVRRIDGWRNELEVLVRGQRGIVYRPNATLLVLLKIGRLSERDFYDCRAAIAHAETSGAAFDKLRVLDALGALPEPDDESVDARRRQLRALLMGQ